MENKNHRLIKVYVTDELADYLIREAEGYGKPLSAYCREKLSIDHYFQVYLEAKNAIKELMELTRKMGTNVNQIAFYCNASKRITQAEVDELLERQRRFEKNTEKIFDLFERVKV